MDFLETIDSLAAGDASASRLFGNEGRAMRRGAHDPVQTQRLAECARFLAEVKEGRRPAYHLQEALSTSDFPLMFGQIVDRMLMANYQAIPQTYRNYAKLGRVADFRTVYRFAMNGAQGVMTQVGELAEYPEVVTTEARYTYAVAKYGKKFAISWEAMVNDALGSFDDIPQRFAVSARNTEEKFATTLFADANGPHASFYTSGNKNQVITANGAATNNPALSIAALQDAMTVLAKQLDSDGNPIVINAVELVVPPALRIVAENILNATQLWITSAAAGGVPQNTTATPTGMQQLQVNNWMRNAVRINVNAFLPVVSTTNGNTSWYLFANANEGRPAMEIGFLRGHETPEIFMRDPDQVRVGGGNTTPMDGDFSLDAIEYKVRMVIGGTRIDPKMTTASNGSGS